jgi:flagellar hook-basal body complex protein FliE
VDAIEVYSSPSSTVDDMHAAFDAIKEAKIHRDNEADNRAAEVLEQFMQSVVHKQLHSDDASKDAYLSCEIEAETVFEHGPIYEVNPSSLAVLSQSLPKCGQAAASK